MLRVEFIGNTEVNADQRPAQKGDAITSLRLAVKQRRQRPDGEAEETTTWFTVRVLGAVAERVAELSKGQRLLVTGRLDIRPYQRQGRAPGVGYDYVWADDLANLSPPAEASETASSPRTVAGPPAEADCQAEPDLEDADDPLL